MRRLVVLFLTAVLALGAVAFVPSGEQAAAGERYCPPGVVYCAENAFLDFWKANGGLEILGLPVSQPFVDDRGLIVQFYERAIMEWHPENEAKYQVLLTRLGDTLLGNRPERTRPAERLRAGRDRLRLPGRDEPHAARRVPALLAGERRPRGLRLPADRGVLRRRTRPTARSTPCSTSSATASSTTRSSRTRSTPSCSACSARSRWAPSARSSIARPRRSPTIPARRSRPVSRSRCRSRSSASTPRSSRSASMRATIWMSPKNPNNTAWYAPGARPGAAGERGDRRSRRLRGDRPGRLLELNKLVPGNEVFVNDDQGKRRRFVVTAVESLSGHQCSAGADLRRHQQDEPEPDLLHRRLRSGQRVVQQPDRGLHRVGWGNSVGACGMGSAECGMVLAGADHAGQPLASRIPHSAFRIPHSSVVY